MIAQVAARVRENIQKVIVGKDEVIDLALVAILCEGHILLEDVPGIGKTMLARTIAASLNCTFKRIQFTPDLLPSDVTGISYFDQKKQEFEFRPGPVMSQVVLADEINRATPRTQSALLEAMQERQTTVDGVTYPLPRPFLVMATQNPIELEGTFPLPEAQVDRFLIKLPIGYPTEEEEHAILLRFERQDPLETLESVTTPNELIAMQQQIREVKVEESVRGYIVDVIRATREHQDIQLGVSPRGTLALYKGAQALAAIRGREYVLPDDVKLLSPYILTHRIIISPATRLRGRQLADVLMDVIETVPAPVERL
ncbi:MAG: AAA family ATPase [Chloroflexi bacterium]|nr:MAG: AAA family ATPase [Anaerolineaceae bacterium 4572_32.2]RLC75880.1 MAG: AAA family ATPase [Chloroflexota bacterium]RLC81266.1 MAG: AAA family ATPase [Chloroflexota bacterium]HEY71729.1 MoxR family ATPase [Thermoflexia bacterium]